jgi:hypothetical protein
VAKEAQRFTIPFRACHTEVASRILARVTPFLIPHNHNSTVGESRQSTDDCRVIAVATITVEFDESVAQGAHIIESMRTARMARQLHSVPWSQG